MDTGGGGGCFKNTMSPCPILGQNIRIQLKYAEQKNYDRFRIDT